MELTTNARSVTADLVVSDTGAFAIIPEWVLDLDVSDRAIRLYGLLARYADQTGLAWPRRAVLAGRLRTSVKSLDRALAELEEAKVVEITPRFDEGGQRSNHYRVRRICPYPSSPVSPPPGHPRPAPLVTGVPQKETQRTRPSEGPSPTLSAEEARKDPSYRFDDFWGLYPKRNGKKVGKAKTLDRWRRLSYEHKAEAFKAVRHYATACEAGLTIARDPERFLSGDYWRDWIDGSGEPDRREPVRPEEKTQAAAIERIQRAQGPKCEECHGVGLIEAEGGAVTCPSCKGSGQVRLIDPENGGSS